MLLLRTEKGKFMIGSLEVEASPVYLGLETDVGWVGRTPPLEVILPSIVSDLYKKDVNLFDANAYRFFVIGQTARPEEKVPDGTIPAEVKRKVIFDFYKVKPVKSTEGR